MKILRTLVLFAIVCVAAGGAADRAEPELSPVVYPPQRLPLIFSHAKHAARGMTCLQCHPAAQTSRSAVDNLMPTEAECRGCHAIDRSDPDKLAIVDLEKTMTVTPEYMQSFADWGLYDGWEVRGWPTMTIVRGQVVMEDGKIVSPEGYGRYIPRYPRARPAGPRS